MCRQKHSLGSRYCRRPRRRQRRSSYWGRTRNDAIDTATAASSDSNRARRRPARNDGRHTTGESSRRRQTAVDINAVGRTLLEWSGLAAAQRTQCRRRQSLGIQHASVHCLRKVREHAAHC